MSRNGGKPMGFSEWNPYAKLTAIVLSFILLAPVGAHAQSFLASVSGIVNDPTGAVVPSVKVVATDTARGVSFTTTSNQDGVYIINNLIPSSYRVTVEAAGFQTYVLNAFPLTAKQEAVLNITLQLGTATQTVEVSSQVQMVDPSNATLGGVVNNTSIVDLPISNRNILVLMAIEPGVQPSTPNNYSSNFFTSAIRYSFNGGLESTSDFQQDGVSILNQSDIPGIMGLTMLLLGFLVGMFQSGIVSGMGACFSELFPAQIRASAGGFSYNFGRACGSLVPAAVGITSAGYGLGASIGAWAAAAYAVVFIAALAMPETRNKELELHV